MDSNICKFFDPHFVYSAVNYIIIESFRPEGGLPHKRDREGSSSHLFPPLSPGHLGYSLEVKTEQRYNIALNVSENSINKNKAALLS